MRNIAALTSIRFIAALAVFVHHYLVLGGHWHFGDEPYKSRLFGLLYEGRFGVTLFFVLSGFLLTARYYDSIHHKINFGAYWIKRFARIMPLYWTICSVVFLINLSDNIFQFQGGGRDLTHFFVFFTLTQAFFDDLKFHGVETAWSLTVEETFYLTLPLLIIMFRRVWVERWALWANMTAAAALMLALAGLYYMIGFGLHRQEAFTLWGFFRDEWGWQNFTIFGRFIDFAIGVFLGLYYIKSRNAPLQRQWLPDVAVLLATAGVALGCYRIYLMNPATHIGNLETFQGWAWNVSNAAFSGLIIYFLCADNSRVARLLSWTPFVYLGQISFAFYLVHKIDFSNWMYRFCADRQVPAFIALVGLYTIFTLMSAFCYEIIERPCQSWILRATGVGRRDAPQPWFARLIGSLLVKREPATSEDG